MKNTIIIDIDTDREQPILIGKGPETTPPTTREEAAKMLMDDIACVTDALINLVHIVDQNQYGDKQILVDRIKEQFDGYLSTPTQQDTEVQG